MSGLKASAWRVLVATTVLALIGVVVALIVVISSGPDFVSGALSRVLGRTVRVQSVELLLGTTLEVELRGVRVFNADDEPLEGSPVFEVQRARGRQPWPRVLAGQFLPLDWTLIEPVVRIRPRPSGAKGSDAQETGGSSFPFSRLVVERGRIEWHLTDPTPLVLRDLQGAASRSALTSEIEGSMTAELASGETPLGGLSFDLGGWANRLEITSHLAGLDLTALPLGRIGLRGGRASGSVTVRLAEEGLDGSVAIDVTDLALELPDFRKALAPRETHLGFTARWRNGAWLLRPAGLRFDDLVISGEVALRNRNARGRLALAPFQLGSPEPRLQFVRLLGLRHETWERTDTRLEAGLVEDFELRFDLTLDELDDVLSFRDKLPPEKLSGSTRVRDAVYRPSPSSAPLHDISAAIHLHGNVLEVRGLRMSREGKPLPEIHLSIDGMHRLARLPEDERNSPPGPGVPIPGLEPAFSALRGAGEGEPPRFRLIDAYIGYPPFVLPFRSANGWLRPLPNGGIALEQAEGVLGGAPALVNATWDRSSNVVKVDVHYHDNEAPPGGLPADAWVGGEIEVETLYLAHWRADRVKGRLRAEGAQMRFEDVRGRFSDGELRAEGWVSLAEEAGAPYQFDLEVEGSDASQFATYLGLDAGLVTGRVSVNGKIHARLEPDTRFVDTAHAEFSLRSEKGTVHDLPITLAIARMSSGTGLRSLFGQALPYDSITSRVELDSGMLRVEDFLLQGPELRIMLAGTIEVRTPKREVDLVMALLLLQTVDRVIEQLPVVRDLILGRDHSLVALYFRLTGPRDEMTASLMTPEAIQMATDWTTGVISGGVSQLRRLLQLPGPEPKEKKDEDGGQTQDP